MEEGHEIKEEKEEDKAQERNKGRRQTKPQIGAMQRGRGQSRQTTCQLGNLTSRTQERFMAPER